VNFTKLCKIACVFIFLISIQGSALAATIHGTVYEWYSFKPLENTLVEINSTPEQSFVATGATYSFNLTSGTYLITANYFENNNIVYTTKEEVNVSDDDGDYVHDLLLFPTYQEDLLDQEGFESVDLDLGDEETSSPASSNSQNTVLIFAFLALCLLVLAAYFIKKEKRKLPEKSVYSSGDAQSLNASTPKLSKPGISEPENFTTRDKIPESAEPSIAAPLEEEFATNFELPTSHIAGKDIPETALPVQQVLKFPDDLKISVNSQSEELPDSLKPENPESSLPDDLKEIMDLIRANGNRITQRELRKKSPYSESKVSLMLSDLEERGLVEKFKKGRGNIIRIPDGAILKQGKFQERKE
jgi:uncharacterized membrane protein